MKYTLILIISLLVSIGCASRREVMQSYEALQYTRALIVEDVVKAGKSNILICHNPSQSRCYRVKDVKLKFKKGDVIFLRDNRWVFNSIKLCK